MEHQIEQIAQELDSIAVARATLEADRKRRAVECSEVIVQTLKACGCRIEVELARQPDGSFRPSIVIEAV